MRKALLFVVVVGCVTDPKPESESQRAALGRDVRDTVASFRRMDVSIARFFDDAYAYAVFPYVGKGGFVFAGAAGDGEVYEQGKMIGWAGISQVSIGAQIGGKSFAQVVFFEKKNQLDRFTSGNLEFGAGVDAVAADHNAAMNTDYRKGVTVFIFIRTGLMADVSASGQQFTFVRK